MQEFTKIIEFRQQIYAHVFTGERDAQFELVDGYDDPGFGCHCVAASASPGVGGSAVCV